MIEVFHVPPTKGNEETFVECAEMADEALMEVGGEDAVIKDREAIHQLWRSCVLLLYALRRDGELVGMAASYIADDPIRGGKMALIQGVYLKKEVRGNKIDGVMKSLKTNLIRAGADTVYFAVDADRENLVKRCMEKGYALRQVVFEV